MALTLNLIQIVLAVLLVGTILLQQRGTGLGGAFGGSGGVYRSKRGIERVLFIATIVIACLFVSVVLVATILQ
ncbi:preprotein translocase subunit SecG [Candidatus Berkelbacteria bacterium]|nr:preprotein translocase subunit SecG [Candidatus Berkelbacteria bacterium]